MNPRSLRFRLIIWYAGLLTGVFLLFGVALYQACGVIWSTAWNRRFFAAPNRLLSRSWTALIIPGNIT